jgi:hypothetical protein
MPIEHLDPGSPPPEGVVVELVGHGFVSAARDNSIRLAHAPSKAAVFANEPAAIGFLATHAPLILQRIPLKFHPRSFEGGAA